MLICLLILSARRQKRSVLGRMQSLCMASHSLGVFLMPTCSCRSSFSRLRRGHQQVAIPIDVPMGSRGRLSRMASPTPIKISLGSRKLRRSQQPISQSPNLQQAFIPTATTGNMEVITTVSPPTIIDISTDHSKLGCSLQQSSRHPLLQHQLLLPPTGITPPTTIDPSTCGIAVTSPPVS